MDIIAWQFKKPAANKKIEHLLAIEGMCVSSRRQCVYVGTHVCMRMPKGASTLDNFAFPDNF